MTQRRITKTDVAVAVLALATLATYSSARTAARGVGEPTPAAVGWHGAWQMYSRLAVWAGQRALLAESAYWKTVRTGD